MDYRQTIEDLYHVLFLIILVIVLVGVLTWAGIIRCSFIPGWCNIYYGILGSPSVLIVYGNEGLGDPVVLEQILRNPKYIGAPNISRQHLSRISSGNLKEFDMVLVVHARQMETKDVRAFMEYADSGGRLVWTGDAGVEFLNADGNEQYLFKDDIDENAAHEIISVWARKDKEGNAVRFDQYISVDYQGNYCQYTACPAPKSNALPATGCDASTFPLIGKLVPEPGTDHKLIYGFAQNLSMYGDFALTQDKGIGSTRVLSVETLSNVYGTGKENLGRTFPVIVTSGIGEKIAYYSLPPEQFTCDPMKYFLIIENMYDGLLR